MRQRDKSFSQQVSYANRERPAGRTFTQFCICPRANRRVHKNETNADSATRRETFLASPKSHCSSKVETRAALRSILCENFDHATKAEHPWWQHSGNPNTLICFWIFKSRNERRLPHSTCVDSNTKMYSRSLRDSRPCWRTTTVALLVGGLTQILWCPRRLDVFCLPPRLLIRPNGLVEGPNFAHRVDEVTQGLTQQYIIKGTESRGDFIRLLQSTVTVAHLRLLEPTRQTR